MASAPERLGASLSGQSAAGDHDPVAERPPSVTWGCHGPERGRRG